MQPRGGRGWGGREGEGRVVPAHHEQSLGKFSRWVLISWSPLHYTIITNMYYICLPTLVSVAIVSVENKKLCDVVRCCNLIICVRNHYAMPGRHVLDVRHLHTTPAEYRASAVYGGRDHRVVNLLYQQWNGITARGVLAQGNSGQRDG